MIADGDLLTWINVLGSVAARANYEERWEPDWTMNCCRAILEMIRELHNRGFEAIRLCPQISNSGVHGIAWLTSAEHVLPKHGAILHPSALMQAMKSASNAALVAYYSSAQGTKYFGWEDADEDSPAQLADKFVERFSGICVNARQADREYVKWFKCMLVDTEPEGLPSICAGSPETSPAEKDRLVVIGNSKVDSIKLPPLPIAGN